MTHEEKDLQTSQHGSMSASYVSAKEEKVSISQQHDSLEIAFGSVIKGRKPRGVPILGQMLLRVTRREYKTSGTPQSECDKNLKGIRPQARLREALPGPDLIAPQGKALEEGMKVVYLSLLSAALQTKIRRERMRE